MNKMVAESRILYKQVFQSKMLPIMAILFAAFLISFSGVYVKLANVTPTVAGFYRMLFGSIILLLITIIRHKNYWHSFKYLTLTIIAGVVISVDLIIWHIAIHYIGPGLATILGNFQVFIMAIFGIIIFKEKIGLRFIIAIVFAMIGLFLMTSTDWINMDRNYHLGIYLGLATALCYSVYLLILRVIQTVNQPLPAVTNLTIISVIAATVLYFVAVANKEPIIIPDFPSFLYLLCYGILSQVIGWGIIVLSLPKVKAAMGGFLLLLQPALSFLWDVLFFDRFLNGFIIIGILITLIGIYLGTTGKSK